MRYSTASNTTLRTYKMHCYCFTGLVDENELIAHILKIESSISVGLRIQNPIVLRGATFSTAVGSRPDGFVRNQVACICAS